MFKYEDLGSLQIELTSRCQASCPMCPRNFHGGQENPYLIIDEWTLEDFKKIVNEEILHKMYHILFCGQYGDALLNPYLIDICQYITDVNPKIVLNIHTNGSLHKEEYWRRLCKSLPPKHILQVGIDGLEDTHSLYRIGTDFNKIINNIKAFINEGGTVTWDFLRFKHNEHQVDEAREYSKKIGCKSFAVKDTTRFVNGESFKVVDKQGNFLYNLEPASNNNVSYINPYIVENYREYVDQSELECMSYIFKRVYIDASKKVYPCGPHAMTINNALNYDDIADFIRQEAIKETQDIFTNIITKNDATKYSLKEIIDSPEWQWAWDQYVHGTKRCITCARNCGKFDKVSLTRFGDEDLERSPIKFD